ncbi:MAG: hypothetical protein RIS47_690 [Bacteroidota bacterium]
MVKMVNTLKSYRLLLVILLLWPCLQGFSQTAFSLKATTWSFTTEDYMKPSGAKLGGVFGIEQYFGSPRTGLKVSQSALQINSSQWVFSTHLMLKMRLYHRKHALSVGVGPVYFLQEADFPANEEWMVNRGWNSKISWTSGELEYTYYLSPHYRLVASAENLGPKTVSFTAGIIYWIPLGKKNCVCQAVKHR